MRKSLPFWLMAAFAILFSTTSSAQQFSALIDADRNALTGCSLVTPAGTVTGIEWRVTATVSGNPPQVSGAERARCLGGAFTAPTAMAAGYPVGLNNGVAGADVIELAAALADLTGLQRDVTVHFLAENAGGADLVGGLPLTIGGIINAPVVAEPAIIPTVHWLGLSILFFAVLLLARRHRALRGVAMVLMLVGAGLVWAANFITDGQVGDWATESPLALSPPDSSTSGDATIEITAVWAADESGRLFFRFDVLNSENEAPLANALSDSTLEDQAQILLLGGSDTEGAALSFAIAQGPANGSLGAITSQSDSTAQVTYTPNADFNGSDSFTFTVNDGQNTSAPATVTLSITAVNDAPGFLAQNANVFENGGAQTATVASAITAGPADEAAQTLSFEIVGNTNPGLFSAGPSIAADGTLSVTPVANQSGSATLSVQLRDNGGTANGGVDVSAAQDIVVTVQGVNKIPSFTAGADVTVLEDSAPYDQPWATSLDDGDGGTQTLSFVISGNTNSALFSAGPAIDGNTGNLSFTLAPDANGSAQITLFLQDDGGTADGGIDSSAPVDLIISATAVNDAPNFAFTAPPASNEDAGVQVAQIANALSSGPADESGQTLGFTFAQTAIDATLSFIVAPSVSASGELSYTAAPDAFGTASFNLSLVDNGGTADGGADTSTVQVVQIVVQPVNDAPSFTATNPPASDEDQGPVTVPGWVTGFNPGPNEAAQVVQDFVVTVTANPALFSVAPAVSAAGELSYTAAPDAFGAATISVAVRDNGGTALGGVDLSPAQSFDITVNGINDAPVLDLNGPAAGVDFAASFTEGGGPVAIVDSAALEITDVDSAQMQNAFLTLIAQSDPLGTNVLAVDVGTSGLTAIYDVSGVLSITGLAPPSVYRDVLRTATYDNLSNDPVQVTREISFTVSDAEGALGVAAAFVSIQAVNTAPSFTPGGNVTVDEDSGAFDTLWATAISDNDGDTQTLSFVVDSVSDPALFSAGPVVDPLSGNLQFTTAPDANGTASIQLRLTDSGSDNNSSAAVGFDIIVTAIDDAPEAVADTATVSEDAGASAIDVLANDTDVDAGPISISSVSQPANGSVVITGGGTGVTYQPNADYCNAPPGTTLDVFTYTLTPGGSSTNVTVTVTCDDDAPVAVADAATVQEDATASAIDVLANDTDLDGGPISITSVTQPANGVAIITGGGTGLTYQPNPNYCNDPPGTTLDVFTYTLTPGGSSTTVTVTVTCVDDAPVAVADAATVLEDGAASAIDVLSNDTDSDGGPISITSVTQPANGVAVITGGGTGLSYQPNPNYCNDPPGTTLDAFTYSLTPGGSSTTVTVTVTCVDDAPVAVPDTASVAENAAASAIDVLANDTDVDGGPISITSITQPANGVAIITGGGTGLSYQPNLNYCNDPPGTTPDGFTYTLTPGGSSTTVSVSVTCIDDPPVAVADAATVLEDSGANAIDVLANDTDNDGGPISITSVSQPADGVVVITGGGTGLTYQPNPNYCNDPPGTVLDVFTYTLTPGGSSTSVTVSVTCVDDGPVAVADAATVAEDAAASAINVLANDTDNDGGPISITSVTQPANGVAIITGGGTGLSYQPNPNYCNDPPGTTPDVFTYTLSPGGSSTSVTVTVTCTDDDPVAVADAATVVEDSGANAIDALANDTDVDGGGISISSVTQPANGVAVITGGGTGLTYQPNPNYCNNPPGTTPDVFTYTLTPGGSSTTVTVNVTCVDDPPTAVADAAMVLEDAGASAVGVLSNDIDIDGGAISITSVTQPANGVVVITGGGTGLTYQPDLNYCNDPPGTSPDTFSYTLSPGGSSASVSISVTCVNDPPVLTTNPITYIAAGNTQLHVAGATRPGLANTVDAQGALAKSLPTDVDGPAAPAAVPATGASANAGNVQVFADGSFTYVPPAGFTGVDSFTIGITDSVDSVILTVNVTVSEMVWYVRDITDANNPAGGDGRSSDAFDNLPNAQSGSGVGHTIFVFEGNTATTPLSAGIVLKNGQRLHGEGIGLTLPTHGTLVAAGNRPRITNGGGNGVTVLANTVNGARTGIEIRGLSISGSTNAIDATSADAAELGIRISENTITAAGQEGIDINIGSSSATQTLAVHDNSLLATGSALDVTRTAGTLTITGFANNSVGGASAGSGLVVSGPNVIFDTTPGGPFDTVSGGALVIGASGNGVGASGLVLNQVAGDLSFASVNVFADAGSGVLVTGTGQFTGAAGMRLQNLAPNAGVVQAVGGPAVSLSNLTADLRLGTITSSASPSNGVNLLNVVDGTGTTAQFAAPAGSSITSATGTAFNVDGGNATVVFGGSITNTVGRSLAIQNRTADSATFTGGTTDSGTGVLLNANNVAHTTSLRGGLALATGANAAFASTGGGTLEICDENPCNPAGTGGLINTITTTTGTALNVSNTTISANGLEFRSLSANGATNGIVLNNTGASGSLLVKGNGGVCTSAGTCTGGAILSTTGDGVVLASTRAPSLTRLFISGSAGNGINASNISNGLTLASSQVINSGNADEEFGLNILNLAGTATISDSTFNNAADDLVRFVNNSTNGNLTVTGSSFIFPVAISATANAAIAMRPNGTSNFTATVQNNAFTNIRGDSLQWGAATAGSSGISTLNFSSNTMTVNVAGRASGFTLSGQELSTGNVTIANNNFFGAGGNGVVSIDVNDTSLLSGTVSGNVISDAPGVGIFLAVDEDAESRVTLSNNTITNSGGDGIQMVNFGGVGVSDLFKAVTNNVVNGHSLNTAVSFVGGISVTSFEDTTCLDLTGNSVTGTPANPIQCGGAPCVDHYLEEVGGVMRFEEVPDTAATTLAAAYVNSKNDAGPVTIFGFIDLTNGAQCPFP